MTEQTQNMAAGSKTLKIVKMGVMVAISVALVYLIHFPIFPAVSFLEYDPADIPILIGTFAFGPLAGLVLTVVTSVVQGLTVSAGSGLYGILMHVIATGVLVSVSGGIYHKNKTRKTAVIGRMRNGGHGSGNGGSQYGHYADLYGRAGQRGMGSYAFYRRV